MKSNLLMPDKGIFRIIFLYVGQGESTLLIVPDGDSHDYILVDANIDEDRGGVLLKDYLKEIGDNNLVFINTHPHNDHVKGIKDIKDLIKEVWHSGHKPSKEHEDSFKELEAVIKKVGEKNVFYLRGTRDLNVLHTDREESSKVIKKIGDIDFQVLSPAKYVCDDIDGEKPEERRKRIHEQCGVIKFTYNDKSVLLTGDSDKTAWKDYITKYHKGVLKSDILSASHHGSRTFFKDSEDDKDIYEDHIKEIEPKYLIISSPKQKDSPHDHPHDDAMDIYKKYVKSENIYHLGDKNKNVIVDIDSSGNLHISDEGDNKDVSGVDNGLLYSTKDSGFKSRPYYPYAS